MGNGLRRDISTRGGRSGNNNPSRNLTNYLNVLKPGMDVWRRESLYFVNPANFLEGYAIVDGSKAGVILPGKYFGRRN